MKLEEAPRSVREWDQMSKDRLTVRSPSPKSHRSHRSRSRHSHAHHRSRSRRGSSPEKIIDVHKDSITIREFSPTRTVKSSKTRRESSPSAHETEIVEKFEVIEGDFDESNSIHVGPLALVVSPDRDRHKSRSERDIKAEIRALEEERRALERERKDRDVVKIKKGTIIRDVDEEIVEVKKDKKGRMKLVH